MDFEEIFQYDPQGNAGTTLGQNYSEGEFLSESEFRYNAYKRQPTEEEKLEANKLKQIGNEYFKKKDMFEALLAYTQAIVGIVNQSLVENDPVYYTNRAMCYKGMQMWKEMADDAETALQLNSFHLKALLLAAESRLKLTETGSSDEILVNLQKSREYSLRGM